MRGWKMPLILLMQLMRAGARSRSLCNTQSARVSMDRRPGDRTAFIHFVDHGSWIIGLCIDRSCGMIPHFVGHRSFRVGNHKTKDFLYRRLVDSVGKQTSDRPSNLSRCMVPKTHPPQHLRVQRSVEVDDHLHHIRQESQDGPI
jgi:hypothetical protein